MVDLGLRIGGAWAQTIGSGKVVDLEAQWRWSSEGGGLHSVTFGLPVPRGYDTSLLRQGTLVQVLAADVSLGWAMMAEPDRTDWRFTCDGLYRRAEHFNAETSSGAPSTVPSTIVAAGNNRGLGWGLASGLPGSAVSTAASTSAQLNTIADVLTAHCRTNNLRWGLDGNNVPYITADPTDVSLILRPDVPAMATADDDYTSRVVVRYATAVSTGGEATAFGQASAATTLAPLGVRERSEDITSLGALTSSVATTKAQAILDANKARPAYTDAVTPTRGQLTDLSGVAPALWLPKHGRRVRHHGMRDTTGQVVPGSAAEFVVGQYTYRAADQAVVLAPVGLAPRTEAQLEETATRATRKGFT